MTFEIEVPTTAKLVDVVVLSQKNRQPDEDPGAKLSFDVPLSNDSLSTFDGRLKGFLFTKDAATAPTQQGTLDGVPVISDTPNLTRIGSHVPVLRWTQELTGYTLTIDQGLGGHKSNLTIESCQLSNWRLSPKQGGTVNVKFDCESVDVSESAFGRLAKLKSRDVQIMLLAAEIAQQDIEGDQPPAKNPKKADGTWPFPKKGKGQDKIPPDPTAAFVAAHKE